MHFEGTTASAVLPEILKALLDHGDEVGSRQGNRTKELLYPTITLTQPWRREILTPGRKALLPAQIAETVWVLSGRADVDWLSHYLPRAKDFSDDGETWRGGYGPRLRSWGGWPHQSNSGFMGTDQLRNIVEILEDDRLSRRAVMSIFDPSIDHEDGKDIPCNNWIHFLSRGGRLHMHVATRSNDVMWGWSGINAFEWSALQEIIAGMLGVMIGELRFSISSLHLYDTHWERARKIADVASAFYDGHEISEESPRFDGANFRPLPPDERVARLDDLFREWFLLEEAIREGTEDVFEAVANFPEPMLRSWLQVLGWWWSEDDRGKWFRPVGGTALAAAALCSPRKKSAVAVDPAPPNENKTFYVVHDDAFISDTKDPRAPTAREIEEGVSMMAKVFDTGGSRESIDSAQAVANRAAANRLPEDEEPDFPKIVGELHAAKDEAYGDSWCRRGEMLGVMANIARKIDRLGGSETPDETQVDTAIDLLVYLVKYRLLLEGTLGGALNEPTGPRHRQQVLEELIGLESRYQNRLHVGSRSVGSLEESLREQFDVLEKEVTEAMKGERTLLRRTRLNRVINMIGDAYDLARIMWFRSHVTGKALSHAERNATRRFDGYNIDPED